MSLRWQMFHQVNVSTMLRLVHNFEKIYGQNLLWTSFRFLFSILFSSMKSNHRSKFLLIEIKIDCEYEIFATNFQMQMQIWNSYFRKILIRKYFFDLFYFLRMIALLCIKTLTHKINLKKEKSNFVYFF